jgi:hypothetical protein
VTKQVSPRESDAVIERLRAADPVRAIERPTPEQVSAFLLDVMERTDMVQDITKPGTEQRAQSPRKTPGWLVLAASFALVMAVAVPVLIWGNDGSAVADLPSDQAAVVTGVVEAVNQENLEAFASHFGPEGGAGFEVGIHRPYHQGVEGGQKIPVTDADGFEADFLWGAALDRRLDLETCQSQSERIVSCRGSVSYEALRTGWLVSVSVAFDESDAIALFATEPLNPDPGPDEAPQELTFIGFHEEFLSWLEQNRRDDYERLVDPGTPGTIGGVEILLTLPPQNPELVADMTALIDEYLRTR